MTAFRTMSHLLFSALACLLAGLRVHPFGPRAERVFVNVGALNSRISELQARVRELEARGK